MKKGEFTEKQIESYLVREVKKRKGIAYKMPTKHSRSWPDRLVLLPKAKMGFAELKSSQGRATQGQMYMISMLSEMGYPAAVIYSKVGVDNFLNRIEASEEKVHVD